MKTTLRVLFVALLILLAVPLLYFGALLVGFVGFNFPFTSTVVAHTSAPTGEEFCVVQTFKSAEPYQVSLYARRSGEAWAWNYLAHQDARWRTCRIEVGGETVRVYRGSILAREIPVAVAVDAAAHPAEALPRAYSPDDLLAHHNVKFRL